MTTPHHLTPARWSQRWLARIDAAFFALGGLAAIWLAYLTFREGIRPGWPMLLMVAFWVLVAYLVLPRVHRILTRIYLPDYFIGRTRTADGLLGDPVNLALLGDEGQVHRAMEAAGWTRADELSLRTGWGIVTSTLRRRSYAAAPVSPLLLFRRQQDFAYQQEVAGSPSKRHHVRFWRCPDGWLLPGGFAVDWLAAGTYDRSVGLSLFTFQVTHKIDPHVDDERDHIIATVRASEPAVGLTVLEDFFTGYHSRNGGGDLIQTDGDLPILDLRGLETQPHLSSPVPAVPAREVQRPSQVVFGVVATGLRALAYLALGVLLLLGRSSAEVAGAQGAEIVTPIAAVFLAAGLADVVFAVGVYMGRNWARLALSTLSVLGLGGTFVSRVVGEGPERLGLSLVPLAISVLVLMALSSEAARSYASKREREAERQG